MFCDKKEDLHGKFDTIEEINRKSYLNLRFS